jgi:fibronectin type 3 domain-containing protein
MRSRRIGAAALGSCLLLSACATNLDLEQAWRMLPRRTAPDLPTLLAAGADLPIPEGLRAVSGELRSVPLKWDPILTGEIGGYAIERAPAPDGPFERIGAVSGRGATTFLDRNESDGDGAWPLEDATTAYYRVRAFAPTGELARTTSAVVSATTASPPAAPEGLRAYSHQPRQVPLSWRASEDPHVASYTVYRSPTSRGPFEPIATLDGRHATVYVDEGLGDLRVFYYGVSARNSAGGEGAPAEAVRAVTKPEPLPPHDLRLVDQRLGANHLRWEPNVEPDVVEYRLYRTEQGAREPELIASLRGGSSSAEDSDVGAQERVSYTLVAIDRDGLESSPAEPVDVTSVGYDLSATFRPDGVHLRWNPRTDEGFRGAAVFAHGWLGPSEVTFVEGDSWIDRSVEPGKRYRYTVTLERPNGSRAPSSSPVEILVPDRPDVPPEAGVPPPGGSLIFGRQGLDSGGLDRIPR